MWEAPGSVFILRVSMWMCLSVVTNLQHWTLCVSFTTPQSDFLNFGGVSHICWFKLPTPEISSTGTYLYMYVMHSELETERRGNLGHAFRQRSRLRKLFGWLQNLNVELSFLVLDYLLYTICGDWAAVSGMVFYMSSFQSLAVVSENERERHVWLESSWQSVRHHSLVGGWSTEARLSTDGSVLSHCQLLSMFRGMLCTNLRWLGNRRSKRHNSCQKLRTKSK